MTNMHAGNETLDIDRFIRETKFAGYQQITLPDGRVIPGTDRSPTADLVFPADLTGKSVLDVGCNYGFFLQEAIRRGARRAWRRDNAANVRRRCGEDAVVATVGQDVAAIATAGDAVEIRHLDVVRRIPQPE